MYVKKSKNGHVIIVGVFVDDLIPSYSIEDLLEWNEIQKYLFDKYQIKDVGNSTLILGMRITRDRKNKILKIDQSDYIQKMLNDYNMQDCKLNQTPTTSYKLSLKDCNKLVESNHVNDDTTKGVNNNNLSRDPKLLHFYQQLIGSLNYASICTRPDITYAVHILSLYLQNPGPNHVTAAKTVLRYLKGTNEIGLIFSANENNIMVHSNTKACSSISIHIDAYCDSDWAGDLDDRHSTTGYVIKLNQSTISWKSKKQNKAALSSCEAEYYAVCAAIQEIIWLKQLLNEILQHDINYNNDSIKINLYVDNQSAIQLSRNDVHHDRSKHIQLRYHFVREEIKYNDIQLHYIPTQYQVADILTKGLNKIAFENLRKNLMETI